MIPLPTPDDPEGGGRAINNNNREFALYMIKGTCIY